MISLLFMLYRAVMRSLLLFSRPYLSARLQRGKELPGSLPQRYGMSSIARPEGRLIWIHGASVGEVNALKSLLSRIFNASPEQKFLVTTSTISGGAIVRKAFGDRVIHQLLPLDHPQYMGRFLDHWKPDLVLWSESDLWPVLCSEIQKRDITALLINARLSPESHKWWRFVPGAMSRILKPFSLILAQSPEDQARFQSFTKGDVQCLGNLKFSKEKEDCQPDRAFPALGDRPVWAAVSTHEGEEALILEAHQQLQKKIPELLLLLAPRHPQRRDEITYLMQQKSCFYLARTSYERQISDHVAVFLVDTIGDLGWVYENAPLTFVGNSLASHKGGHDIIEPALWKSVPLHGPVMENFSQMTQIFEARQADFVVTGIQDIVETVSRCLEDKTLLTKKKRAMTAVLKSQAETLNKVYECLTPYLIVK